MVIALWRVAGHRRMAALAVLAVLAASACGSASSSRPGPSTDVRFTLTFRFDNRPLGDPVWTEGTFTTTGGFSRQLLDSLTDATTELPTSWSSSGTQTFQDYACSGGECLTLCVGKYVSQWSDTPQVALVQRSAGTEALTLRLSSDPKASDDQFLQGDCVPEVGGGNDGFPPMLITLSALDTASPQLAVASHPDEGTLPIQPGEVFDLTIAPLP